jgi:signal transduction histidine kinase
MDTTPIAARRFDRRINHVFFVLAVTFIALATGAALALAPALRRPQDVAKIAALVVAYLGWLWWCTRWPGGPAGPQGVRALAWLVLLLLGSALTWIHPVFVSALFMLAGQSFGLLRVPYAALAATAALAAALWVENRWALPDLPLSAGDWFAWGRTGLLGAMGLFVAAVFSRLIHVRYENEGLIRELEASRQHVAAAAAQERELAVLRERERLARDLHDVLGHALVLAAVKLEAAQRLQPVDPPAANAELDATKQLVRDTMGELRRTVASLRAAPRDGHTPAHAVAQAAREVAAHAGLALELQCEEIEGLGAAQEEALRRVAQEALTNVAKHAAAARVRVVLNARAGVASLTVEDDGQGFPETRPTPAGHFGIRGMYERVTLAGGTLAVESTPGSGTRIRAEVPLQGAGHG